MQVCTFFIPSQLHCTGVRAGSFLEQSDLSNRGLEHHVGAGYESAVTLSIWNSSVSAIDVHSFCRASNKWCGAEPGPAKTMRGVKRVRSNDVVRRSFHPNNSFESPKVVNFEERVCQLLVHTRKSTSN